MTGSKTLVAKTLLKYLARAHFEIKSYNLFKKARHLQLDIYADLKKKSFPLTGAEENNQQFLCFLECLMFPRNLPIMQFRGDILRLIPKPESETLTQISDVITLTLFTYYDI